MSDTVSQLDRSRIMAAVKSKHTTPELIVRRLSHRLGYRHRLHVKSLPGTPDLVYPRLGKIIEVRGCFWHMHNCGRCRIPATRRAWWLAKLRRNVERDRNVRLALRKLGWTVLVIWECETRNPTVLKRRISKFLGQRDGPAIRQPRSGR